jgi:hypothetical protein
VFLFKGDASLFRHFASLLKGFYATHQSSAGYPVSRERDIENFGEYPVSFFSFGHPETRIKAPANSLLCPFAIAPLNYSRTCDLGAKTQNFLCKALVHLYENQYVQQKPKFWPFFGRGLRYTLFWLEHPA